MKKRWSLAGSTQETVMTLLALGSGWPSAPMTVVIERHRPGARFGRDC
jgi:hypothetical protein